MVNLRNCKWNEFLAKLRNRPLYCFGCGELAKRLSKDVSGYDFYRHVVAFVDNDERKAGNTICLDDRDIPVISYPDFVKSRVRDSVMLITSMYYDEMLNQIDKENTLSGMECYIEVFLEEEKIQIATNDIFGKETGQIPKIIHYCWFGKKEIPDLYKQYINSWKRHCPDYQIIRWDESNYDYTKTMYTKEAYETGKWAFVSDYARLDIVYNYGGIYLDVDVEILKNFDLLLRNDMFCSFEKGNLVNTGLGFGAVKGFTELGKMRDMYQNIHFLQEDGSLNLTACTKYQTDYLVNRGLERNGKLQVINGIRVLPRTVLSPIDFYGISDMTSDETFAVHHYAASWFSEKNSKDILLRKNSELRKRMDCYVECC